MQGKSHFDMRYQECDVYVAGSNFFNGSSSLSGQALVKMHHTTKEDAV